MLKMKNDSHSGMPKASGESYKPVRMCAACRKREVKDKLIRIVRNGDGTAKIDLQRNAQERGAYLCRNEECVRRAQKTRALARSLQCGIGEDLYEEIIRSIKNI